jgi:hypothetical protein
MIVKTILPDLSPPHLQTIDSTGRSPLQGIHDLGQRPPSAQLNHPVNVVRHHDVGEVCAITHGLPQVDFLNGNQSEFETGKQLPSGMAARRYQVDSVFF